MSNDVTQKLLESEPVQSLLSEAACAEILREQGWDVLHGSYYRDRATGKEREVDVVAGMSWHKIVRVTKKAGALLLGGVTVVAEMKGGKAFHLVFARNKELSNRDVSRQDAWLGWEGKQRLRVIQVIRGSPAPPELQSELVAKLGQIAYPRSTALVGGLMPNPPEAAHIVSAFRETNIGTGKDLDASMLWKTGLALRSAVSSLRRRYLNRLLSDLQFEFKWRGETGHLNEFEIVQEIRAQFSHCMVYHPLIVVDSPLWIADGKTLEPVTHCRFVLRSAGEAGGWWFDVVHASAFATFVKDLGAAYTKKFRLHRFKEFPSELQEFRRAKKVQRKPKRKR